MNIALDDGRTELWQWDTGRRVKITDGVGVKQIHYQKRCFGHSVDVDVEDDGTAIIPDELMQDYHTLTAYAYVTDDAGGYTKVQQDFEVHKRPKPSDYIYTPTERAGFDLLRSEIGDLADLTTEEKENLVAAINEVARMGGRMDLRVADGYIQYSTDSGSTWANLIAMADLKGDPGTPGKEGHSPVVTATKSGKTTTISVDGAAIATVEDGSDGHTPVKGTDYWTSSDKAEVVAESAAAIDLMSYAKKNEVPTKTSQLTNDSGFLTSHQDISGKQDKATLEADVASKGFTKNTGTYSKPAGGIPKSDLDAAAQTSLGKADTALQEHQSLSAYRTAAAQDEIDSGKVDKVTGKGLSTNDYTAAAKAKVDAIPANPKYTDTVYDDTALKERVTTIEGKESAWDAKLNASELPTAINTALAQAKESGEFDGKDGKSAYQYAVEGGYTDTEEVFAAKLASGALTVHVTDNNDTLSADKSYIEISGAILAGIPVFVDYGGVLLPFTMGNAESLRFGITQCDDNKFDPAIIETILEITPNGEVNDISSTVETLPNPNAITFTGAVTGSYTGYAPLSVNIPTVPTKTSQLTNDSGFLTSHQSLSAYRTAAAQDEIDSGKVDKVTGKGLSTNDYTAAAKAKVDAIPANPKYTDTVYDDTALKERVTTIEGKESAWDAKSDFSGSYNDLTDKPTIPTSTSQLTNDSGYLTLATLPIYNGEVQ